MIIPRMFDCLIYPATTMLAAAVALMIGQVVSYQEMLFLLLLPFIGSMMIVWFAMWANPNPETRRVTGSRAGFALFLGTVGPSIIAYFMSEKWQGVVALPHFALFFGGAIAFVVYILSYPFCLRWYAKATVIAEALADKSQDVLAQKVGAVVAKEAVKVAVKLKDEPISPEVAKNVASQIIAQASEAIKESPEAASLIEVAAETIAKKVDEKQRY